MPDKGRGVSLAGVREPGLEVTGAGHLTKREKRISPKRQGFPPGQSPHPGSGVGEGREGWTCYQLLKEKQGHLDWENGEGGLPNGD